ncbi:unnamed protein product [Kuraishia capsulata CBS 1993]|uniref:Arf-GAP domain-containing protein n=1 Tax=Kuraishia capsulata CBS 1993 TaxID=1382522 RepID=W6MJB7_9ASCO|nr:uncharacterized protein KUCA_T00000470001 [Kuraishia capsulata CBS 1993]CDK24507.1 unnamed protein product [Kuraishia capsulata CBS 1993]
MSRYGVSTSSAAGRKTHNEKNQQILKALLKEPANRFCSDCKNASHPRWASWNLGIFICIRCSGIHRSMGTHISRVKSVDLDSWTDEQVASMVKWGNDRANAYWEAKLPSGHVPDDSKIENFIRTKYDLKKWAASPTVPDPSSINVGASSQPQAQVQRQQAPIAASVPAPPVQQPQQGSLLDLDFISAPAKDAPPQQPLVSQQTSSSASSFLDTPVENKNTRPDLKKSILSLYSTPTASQSSFNTAIPQTNYTTTPAATTANTWAQPQPQQSNVWASSTSAQPKTNPLDDDLFKNVWN